MPCNTVTTVRDGEKCSVRLISVWAGGVHARVLYSFYTGVRARYNETCIVTLPEL